MQAMTTAVDMSAHTHSDEYNRYLSRIREKFTARRSFGGTTKARVTHAAGTSILEGAPATGGDFRLVGVM
jgi:hypothetical protein